MTSTEQADDEPGLGPDTATSADSGPGLEWRRPHPFTLLLELGRAFRSVVVVLVLVQGDFFGGGSLVELGLVLLPLGAAMARWYTTRYAVDVESIHHHYGLLWRKRQVLPRANIQNVTTKAGLVARFASVLELQVSDASATGDISIRYISVEEADRLATLLRSSMPQRSPVIPPRARTDGAVTSDGADNTAGTGDGPISTAGPAGVTGPGEHLAVGGPTGSPVDVGAVVEPSLRELVWIETTSIPNVAMGAVAALGPVAALVVIAVSPRWFPAQELGRWSWLIVAGAAVGPLLLAAAQVAANVLLVGGFRLTADPDRLRIRVGLVTESRVTARRERIQQIRVLRQLVHRRLGLERVQYETADLEAADSPATSYLAPVALTGGWVPLAVEAFGQVDLSEAELRSVSPLTRRRVLIRFAIAGSVLAAATALLSPVAAVAGLAVTVAVGRWYSRRRFEVIGWATSADQILIRSGVVFQTLTLARMSKIQALRLRATYFQRRLNLATLQLSTAGHGSHGLVTLPDLPADQAEQLLDQLGHRSAETPIADTL